ncbi:hypothetical protein NIES2100_46980 [Calothrix sp. NIES-2100]|uniref:hypothetical protein n=1 Tax=Calothrix sp. NIES-2100 TaxID=1954172 RepID=UPI000B60FAFF|nr:hypothetical protein NIES2100_46980 [Calothrix sp. NIES-2100]
MKWMKNDDNSYRFESPAIEATIYWDNGGWIIKIISANEKVLTPQSKSLEQVKKYAENAIRIIITETLQAIDDF